MIWGDAYDDILADKQVDLPISKEQYRGSSQYDDNDQYPSQMFHMSPMSLLRNPDILVHAMRIIIYIIINFIIWIYGMIYYMDYQSITDKY